jgi:phosphoglycolate phosphatase-like HAD superfamily hydrolase
MTPARSLVLFDIDGTLMRGAGRHHKDALVEGIRRVTGRVTTLDGVSTSGTLDRDLISAMLRASGESKTRIRRSLSRIVTECQACYAETCAADLTPFVCTGVHEILGGLRARGAIAGLVTGNLSRIGWRKVELAGLRHYFSLGAFAENGRTRKRLAQIAAWHAKRERLIASDARISLIGDHTNDVEAAKANGFYAVAVATGLSSLEELRESQPDILVSSLSELDVERLL